MQPTDEWQEYDHQTRRSCVAFRVPDEHFAFVDHEDILDIRMTDTHQGFVVLKTRRRRSFFARLLPSADLFMPLNRRHLPPAATPPSWCTGERVRLLVNK